MSGRRLLALFSSTILISSTVSGQPPLPKPVYYPRPVQTFPAQIIPVDSPGLNNGPAIAVPQNVARPSVPISHPDQIELQLKTLTEQFAATGLIEEARATAAIASRVREFHFDRLQAANRAFPAQQAVAIQKQIVLRVQMAEMQVTPASLKFMSELLGDQRYGQNPAASRSLSGVFEPEQINKWLTDAEREGFLRTVSRTQATILNGRSTQFKFAPDSKTSQHDNESAQSTLSSEGKGNSAKFIGTAMDASAAIRENNIVALRLIAEITTKGPEGGVDARRVQTESEIRDGQTLVLGGLLSAGTLTEVTRVPFLGDIPLAGRLFSSRKTSAIETELLIVVTPEIVTLPAGNRNNVLPAAHSSSGR